MIIEIGHFALILALVVAGAQMFAGVRGAQLINHHIMAMSDRAAILQFILLLLSFLCLIYGFLVSDFSISNVALNSHSEKPLLYKISGAWGSHEGSMILWVFILSLFGAAVALFGRNLPQTLRANVLGVQASIAVAFSIFILFTSNPFLRLNPAPFEGRGLNPILQDPALAFHPPFLYAGYVGFSIAFSFALAALIEGRIDAAWARWVRPWTLAAWMFLTLGISMGSWWAYYELGWGGWWFWDPVENASLMPWLAGTALLHSALVMEKREALKVWTILLAIITFSLSLVGTFLVRSGVLTSVHAFAVDPARGVFILLILLFFTGGGLAFFAARVGVLRQGGIFAPISREGSLVLNNILLSTACATVFIGTLYPLALEILTGEKISVGAPFFNLTFIPLMIPLLLALPFGPLLQWKRGDLYGVAQRLLGIAVLSLVLSLFVYALQEDGPWLAPLAVALGFWVLFGSFVDLLNRCRAGSVTWSEFQRRFFNQPRSAYGTVLAHGGVGILVLGIVFTSAYKTEEIVSLKIGESTQLKNFSLTFKKYEPQKGPNYSEQIAFLEVSEGGQIRTLLTPSKRLYTVPPQSTTEAGIYPLWTGDLYVALGDENPNGSIAFRIYFHPFVRLIWGGTFLMFCGGLISLSDRRLRIGAPRGSQAMPMPVPAE
ncbi:MAG: heme lyase CcmF/NrfE family subunit [Hyphomicrobium sp.]